MPVCLCLCVCAVTDGEVVISPKSDPAITRVVNQAVILSCSAILGKEPAEADVEWEWSKRDEGETDFSALEAAMVKTITVKAPVKTRCGGYNSTSGLPLSVGPQDNHRTYRCAYKNKKNGEKAEFDYKLSKTYVLGVVKSLDPGEKTEAKVVYSQASLFGMIAGLLSFFCVSFLGAFYVYRKNRGGKKYDIVTALLNQEEEELAKLEERLGVVPPPAVVGGAAAAEAVGEESGDVGVSEEASSVANEEASEGGTEDD
ncbi:uncharacterized protein [Littorina saxatilis]|uniref:uncharacterized protein n=1 Tax=Littorina saxatilis TaxID=31220 RepID=UPI0038B52CE4